VQRSGNDSNLGAPLLESVSAREREVLNEGTFQRMISIERKTTERSRKPFLLMLLDTVAARVRKRMEKPSTVSCPPCWHLSGKPM
jgi:hypothetical protein